MWNKGPVSTSVRSFRETWHELLAFTITAAARTRMKKLRLNTDSKCIGAERKAN
jgi:hypothetical protein